MTSSCATARSCAVLSGCDSNRRREARMPRNASRSGRRSRAQDGEDASAACDARRHRQRIIGTPFLVVFRDDAAAACVQPVLETDLVERLLARSALDFAPMRSLRVVQNIPGRIRVRRCSRPI